MNASFPVPEDKSLPINFRPRSICALVIIGFATGAGAQEVVRPSVPSPEHLAQEAPFIAENAAAMDKMMADMEIKPTGDVDADFSAMMIPHHQGAIAMALAELRHGRNEQLRRIAQEIVVEQQQEIIAMRLALGQTLPPSAPAETQATPGSPVAPAGHDHSAMSHGAMSISPTATR